MSKDELAAWELALAHLRQARDSVERLHRRLVVDGVVERQQAWRPMVTLRLAVGALDTARRARGRFPPSPRRPRPHRDGWRPDVQGGLCNGK